MNLEESNSFVEEMERNNKNKKTVLNLIIIGIVIILLLVVLIFYIRYRESQVLKMYVDDKEVPISSTLLISENGQNYINIKQLSKMVGDSYQKGEYKQYNEDEKSCYIKNDYEVASMSADSVRVTKYILNENDGTSEEDEEKKNKQEEAENQTEDESVKMQVYSNNETIETLYLEDSIIYRNNELYAPFSEVERIFNINLNTSNQNRILVQTINYLAQAAPNYAQRLQYSEVSDIYENITAMVDDMLVVGNEEKFGVVSLEDGHEIISLKYDQIIYMQNTKEFLVMAEGSAGVISDTGKTIIKPTEYDSISNIDEINKLYLISKDEKYGVLNGNGEIIVHPEYDSIGIENQEAFRNEGIRNFSLLYDTCIPVNSGGKVGIINKDGNEKLRCVYDSFGFVANEKNSTSSEDEEESKESEEQEEEESNTTKKTTTNKTVEEIDNVLVIPESTGIKGIVVKRKDLYGIFDASVERLIIPCVYSKIYSKTRSGITTYYLEYNDEEIELESYLEENDLKSIDNNRNQEEDSSDEEQQEDDEDVEVNEE